MGISYGHQLEHPLSQGTGLTHHLQGKGGQKEGRTWALNASFESSQEAARPASHPETQNPCVEESGRE